MDFSALSPISDRIVDDIALSHRQTLGRKLALHTSKSEPVLKDVNIAIFGVLENRNSTSSVGNALQLNEIRKVFYELFPGNWSCSIADLGDIQAGETTSDTYFAVTKVVESLLKQDIIPIIIGGSQDLTYAQYRAYDKVKPMINIVNIDKSFDLGDSSKPISNQSYIGKI
ncbi:MAG: arginase family protein, partial [Flavobacteriaceae bacterium]